MKTAFVNQDGVLVSFGYMAADGDNLPIEVDEDFDHVPGEWKYVDDEWIPYVDPVATAAANAAMRDGLLRVAAVRIAPLQDAADLDVATAAETAALKAWKTYRIALNRVDVTAHPAVWPTAPTA